MKRFAALVAAPWLLLLTIASPARAIEQGTEKKPGDTHLKPGEYVWNPQGEDKGAIDIVVSLGQQQLFVYQNGARIGRSTISSGSKGRETPTGIYMILEKNVTHHSNKYHEASMPFMERLTWGGLAIHAGNTPGHPESHGCMHVPEEFAKKLYGLTEEGNTVLVANAKNDAPKTTRDPNALFAEAAPTPQPSATPAESPAAGSAPAPAFTLDLQKVPNGPYLVIFTSADKRVYLYRKGVEIGRADLGGIDAGKPFGNAVYAAMDDSASSGGLPAWSLLGLGDGAHAPDLPGLAKRLTMPPEFRQKVRDLVKPGLTLVLTDHSADNAKPDKPDED